MKTIILIAVLTNLATFSAVSQNRSAIWQLGRVNVSTGYSYYLDFSSSTVDTGILSRNLKFFITNASICDTSGELLFYTNGVWVANKNHDTLFNSQDFNPGFWTEFYGDDGLGIPQASLFLPNTQDENEYLLIHLSGEYDTFYNQIFSPVRLGLSLINLSADGGLGGITPEFKNLTLVEDTLEWGRLTACKHANGRDWWLITHKFHSDLYYKVSILPDTILVFQQQIGNVFTSYNAGGMALFSPDASKYVHLNMNDTIDLLNFDRCTGEFSNFVELSVPDTGILSSTLGGSFSPNNRFLYVSTYLSLYQFDTWANDIQASMLKVGSWEDQTGWPDWFFLHQLAPDGKIYISLFNGDHWLHVINDPDSLGVSCNFVQGGLILPQVATSNSLPNLPNYDLGPLQGSPCDTVYTSNPNSSIISTLFKLSPNPVSDWLNINYSIKDDCQLYLYNMNGEQVAAISLFPYFKNRLLHVSHLPSGIYIAIVACKGEQIWSEKVVVQR
jgi:hypothetical protein